MNDPKKKLRHEDRLIDSLYCVRFKLVETIAEINKQIDVLNSYRLRKVK